MILALFQGGYDSNGSQSSAAIARRSTLQSTKAAFVRGLALAAQFFDVQYRDRAARLGRAHGLSLWQVALCDETSPLVPSASARVDNLVSVFAAVFRRTGQRDLAALPDARVLASTAVTASASRVVVGRVVGSDRVVGAVV